jgi:hypothetical protein
LWAGILAEAFGLGLLGSSAFVGELRPLKERWRQEVGQKPLPWYAEEKLRIGAFATLAGLEISDNGNWSAIAVGDSCIIQIRASELIQSFPLDRSEQFDNRPFLISSRDSSGNVEQAIRRIDGNWKIGDIFYLMTDALACYFLRQWKNSDDPVELLGMFNELDAAEFKKHMNDEREQSSAGVPSLLRNDDLTFVRCRIRIP